MPKFLAGHHYNEEEISQHLEKNVGYWPVQMNGNKFATDQTLKKTGRSCEGADFSWLSSKVSRTLCPIYLSLQVVR
jgi:ABC-type phosphate transport system auxiliary subunit